MQRGFHLIEILITLTFISILAALSLPIYSHHLIKARRLEAIQTLGKLAVAMETYYIGHNTYHNATLRALHFLPQIAKGNYQLSIQTATDFDYVLAAIPLARQAEKDSACGTLTLNERGEKNINGSGSIEHCW